MFAIDAAGFLVFQTAPDAEMPGDVDLDNTYAVEITATDTSGNTATQAISVTVTDINDNAPIAAGETTTLEEDPGPPVVLDLTLGDSDPDASDTLTYEIISLPTKGTLFASSAALTAGKILSADELADLIYRPNANENGEDSFTYTVSDGLNTSSEQTHTLAITPINDAPLVAGETTTLLEDVASVQLYLTSGDTDIDGDTLTYAITSLPTKGTLFASGVALTAGKVLSADELADLTFVPALNEDGSDSFTYTVSDGTITSAAQTHSLTITPVGDAPVLNGTLDQFDTIYGGTPIIFMQGLLTAVFDGDLVDPDSSDDGSVINRVILDQVPGAGQGTLGLFAQGSLSLITTLDVGAYADFTYDAFGDLATATYFQANGTQIAGADITSIPLYTPPATGSGDLDVTFAFKVVDEDGNASQTIPQTIKISEPPPKFSFDQSGNAGTGGVVNETVNESIHDYDFSTVSADIYDASATDPDSGTITYAIVGGADATPFIITDDGKIQLGLGPDLYDDDFNPYFSFEHPLDANNDGIYELVVQANTDSGGGQTIEQTINFTLQNIDTNPDGGILPSYKLVEGDLGPSFFQILDAQIDPGKGVEDTDVFVVRIESLPDAAVGTLLFFNDSDPPQAVEAGAMLVFADEALLFFANESATPIEIEFDSCSCAPLSDLIFGASPGTQGLSTSYDLRLYEATLTGSSVADYAVTLGEADDKAMVQNVTIVAAAEGRASLSYLDVEFDGFFWDSEIISASAMEVYDTRTDAEDAMAGVSYFLDDTGAGDDALFDIDTSTGVITYKSGNLPPPGGSFDGDDTYELLVTAVDEFLNVADLFLDVTIAYF